MSRPGEFERTSEKDRPRLHSRRQFLRDLALLTVGSSLVAACGPGQTPIDALPTVAPATTPSAAATEIPFARRAATPAIYGTLPPNADVEVVPSGSGGRNQLLQASNYYDAVRAVKEGKKTEDDVQQAARRLVLLRTKYLHSHPQAIPGEGAQLVDVRKVNLMDSTDLTITLAITEAMLRDLDKDDKNKLNFPLKETVDNLLKLRDRGIKFAPSVDLMVPAAELSMLEPVLEIMETAGKPYPKELKKVEEGAIGFDSESEVLYFSERNLLRGLGLYYATESPGIYGEFEKDTKEAEDRAGKTLKQLDDERYASVSLVRGAERIDDFARTFEAFVTRRKQIEDQVHFNFQTNRIQAAEILEAKLKVFDRWMPGVRTLEKAKPGAPPMLDLVSGDKLEVYDPAFYPQNGIITKDDLSPGTNPNRPAVRHTKKVTLVDPHPELIADPGKAQASEYLLVAFTDGWGKDQTGYVPRKHLKRAS